MVRRIRNLCLYLNVYLMDQISSQIRQYRPIAVDKTEVTTYCIAPKGESAEARTRRIRQYEDFFNASGMATPDDLEEFRACQMSYRGRAARWNDLSRGARHWLRGPNAAAQTMDVYLNGVLDNGAMVGTIASSQMNSSVPVAIGKRSGASGYEFNGGIDEVQLYNRALSAAEIQADMNAALGPPDTTVPAVSLTAPTGGAAVTGAYLLVVLLNFVYLYPILAGKVIPYASWLSRMWYHGWI